MITATTARTTRLSVSAMEIKDKDYWIAAASDIAYEELPVAVVQAAHDVSATAEQFFYAVQASIKLKEIQDGGK